MNKKSVTFENLLNANFYLFPRKKNNQILTLNARFLFAMNEKRNNAFAIFRSHSKNLLKRRLLSFFTRKKNWHILTIILYLLLIINYLLLQKQETALQFSVNENLLNANFNLFRRKNNNKFQHCFL